MTVKLTSPKCPVCGAELELEQIKTQGNCPYCGAEVFARNENEYIFRYTDEADLKRAETDEKVRLKQIELSEKEKEEAKEIDKERVTQMQFLFVLGASNILVFGGLNEILSDGDNLMFGGMAFLGVLAIVWAAYIGLNLSGMSDILSRLLEEDRDSDEDGLEELAWLSNELVDIPDNLGNFKTKSYKAVEALFESAGFTNVRCISLNDLRIGLINKPGMVESISIDGKDLDTDKSHPRDASVVILYHSVA